jgi:4-hydroxythreonine-4-phosphate dehydrogenase
MLRTLELTPGDPTGIGPEVTAKALLALATQAPAIPLQVQVWGDVDQVQGWLQRSLAQASAQVVASWQAWQAQHLHWQPVAHTPLSPGELAWRSLQQAVASVAQRQAQGQQAVLVTGPISKANWQAVGLPYTGHTEALQALAQEHWPTAPGQPAWLADMAFVYQRFRLLLLTRHCALVDVPHYLADTPRCLRACQAFGDWVQADAQRSRESTHPSPTRIALLGLNPHAGELALTSQPPTGHEEALYLAPLLAACQAANPTLHWQGPLPADGFFRGFSATQPSVDGVVACTHDQGLIPMKLLGGHEALNVTLGLPFVRVSVSHGTAPDIAGQGKASAASMLAALHYALGAPIV